VFVEYTEFTGLINVFHHNIIQKNKNQSGDDVKSFTSIQIILQDQMSTMSPTLAKAADWLSRHTPEVAWKGIEEIARDAEVSPATILRAIKQCGFDGYSDLQRKIREQLPDSSLVWKLFHDDPAESELTQIGAVVANEKSNLDQLETLVSPIINELVDTLLASRRTFVVASLMTAPLAEYLALHLRLLLQHVEYVDAASSHAWLMYRELDDSDCVIGLSYPRYSEATRHFLTKTLERTPHVILMTDQLGPVLNGVQLTVRLPSVSHFHYSSNVSLMALTQVLARGLRDRDPERIMSNLSVADEIWTQLNVITKMPKGDL
jgi:DNA-binding MurR/RpiR family transcriptional regulator